MSKKNKELPEFINIGELYEGKTKRAKQWLSGALSEAKKQIETNYVVKPIDWEKIESIIIEEQLGDLTMDAMMKKIKQQIMLVVQGLLREIEKIKKYTTNIQKEDLTEYIRGYWKGQENLIKEIEHLIHRCFPKGDGK